MFMIYLYQDQRPNNVLNYVFVPRAKAELRLNAYNVPVPGAKAGSKASMSKLRYTGPRPM